MDVAERIKKVKFKEFKDFLYANLDPLTQFATIRIKIRGMERFCQIYLTTHDIAHFTTLEDFIYCMDTTAQHHGLDSDMLQTIIYVVRNDGYLECLGIDDGYAAHWNRVWHFNEERKVEGMTE